jgi:CheY-like chemotaxis protein
MKKIKILLAEDDKDDRFFFTRSLNGLPFETELTVMDNGEKLLHHLLKNYKNLPDILFLDLNMPRKNGSECLEEIKGNSRLKSIPVVIYTTSMNEDVADLLYTKGAHYYIRKVDIIELPKILSHVLTLVNNNNFKRPKREGFLFKLAGSGI